MDAVSVRFQASWFEKFPWLHYDEGFNVARCYICYRQHEKSALNSCRNQEAFIKTGYSNWKNALDNFRKHEKSLCHMTAIAFENALRETSGNVAELISMNAQKTMAVNRQCLLQIIECCGVLARQNIAFQGATEVDSNFFQILKFKASDCPDLRAWLAVK